MPIASVVLTLDLQPERLAHAWGILNSDVRIDLGQPAPPLCPAVIDTATAEEGIDLVQSLEATIGIVRVDVVAIDYACDEETNSS